MITAELTELLKDPGIGESDRQTILQTLRQLADKGDVTARLALVSDNLEPVEDSRSYLNLDLDPLTIIAHFQARQQALYETYKAEGLTAAECVARFSEENVNGHLPLHYSLIEWRVAACEKESGGIRYRYHLPALYKLLKATPAYDWPARELGEATMAKYFPHEWLTRELFEEMVELMLYIETLDFTTREQTLKSHPTIERVRQIKTKYPTSYGLIPDNVDSAVYSLMRG
jgi:hypothetical protein